MTSVELKKSKADIIVAKDWFEKKSINWYLKNARCIPMDRYGVDTGWLRNSKEAVKKGESIIIFLKERQVRMVISESSNQVLLCYP